MKKEIKMIPEKSYTISPEEMDVIEKCLRYCKHRLHCHPEAGIHKALSKGDWKLLEILLIQI